MCTIVLLHQERVVWWLACISGTGPNVALIPHSPKYDDVLCGCSAAAAFAEGMSLADKSGLKQDDLLDVLGLGAMANPMFGEWPALYGCRCLL
jgi:hypothetical protein